MKTKPAYHTSAEMQHTSVLIDSNSETSRENIKSKRSGKTENKNRNYFLGAGFVVLFLFVLFSVSGRDDPKNVEKSVMDWFSGKKQAETVSEITESEVFKIDTTPFELTDFTSTTNAPTTEKPTTTQELTTTTRENLEKLVETTTASPSSWGSWVWGEKQAETVSEITESGISQVTTAPLKRIDFNRHFTSNLDEIPEFVQAAAVLETTESVEPEASGLLAESPVTSSEPEATTTTTVEPLSTNAPTTEKPTTTRKLTTTTNENVEKSVTTTTTSPSSWGSWVWGKKQAETVSAITESNVSPVTTAEPETTTTTTVRSEILVRLRNLVIFLRLSAAPQFLNALYRKTNECADNKKPHYNSEIDDNYTRKQ